MSVEGSIVVTGLGTLGAPGAGSRALIEALDRGDVPHIEVDRSSGFHQSGSARTAALLGRVGLHDWVKPMVARRLSPPSRYAVAAARMALEDAGLDVPPSGDTTCAVSIATAFGPSSYTQKLLDQILHEGPTAASPSVFTECVANAPAGQIAIHCNAAGPNYTLSNREAGCLLAVARGADDVLGGRATRALSGTVEEITPVLHAILDRFRALARPNGRGEERARPFDRRRNGFLAASGATILVLESSAAAAARRAEVLVRLRGWGGAFDPTATSAGWGSGARGLAGSLLRVMRRAGVDPAQIDLIVSGASGSRSGDRLEAHTLREAWAGKELPPVVAPKSITGEYGGGFLAAAILAAAGRSDCRTVGFEEADPELGIVPRTEPVSGAARTLVSCLAAGGAAAWLILERP